MLFRKKHPPVGLMIVLVMLLFGVAGCFKDAGDDTAPTKVNLRELDPVISTPLASNTPSVPTFTPAPEIGATKTQIIGGPPVNTVESETSGVNGEEVTPPPTFTPPPTVDLADATLPPAGFADTGISPTPSLTLTVTLEPGLPTPTPVAPPDKCIYVIQAGDTLYSVAFELDIFPEDFYPVNPELAANPNSLYIGQEIRIPDCISETATVDPNAPAVPVVPDASPATQAPPPSGSAQTYTVQSGDNLFRISLRFGITVEQLVAANPGTLVNQNTVIQPGMILNIPAASQ